MDLDRGLYVITAIGEGGEELGFGFMVSVRLHCHQ